MRCGECLAACPQQEDSLEHPVAGTAEPGCTYCGECVAACPTGARQIIGESMSVQQVIDEVLRDRKFFDQSGGGATISGGEPLMQAAFVRRLLEALRHEAIHTALDTSGFAPTPALIDVAPWVDLFLFDVKSVDTARHLECTGASNELILKNLETLSCIHDNIWIRVPLIPGFNLDPPQLAAAARYIATLPAVKQVNLLPYHRMGVGKGNEFRGGGSWWGELNVSDQEVAGAAEIFRAAGLHTLVGG